MSVEQYSNEVIVVAVTEGPSAFKLWLREEVPTDIPCDKCGKMMVVKWGRNGRFLACPGGLSCGRPFRKERSGGRLLPVLHI